MIKIGTIRRGTDLGFSNQNSNRYIWVACTRCGGCRWVTLYKGKPKDNWCKKCAAQVYRGGKIVYPQEKREKSIHWKGGKYVESSHGYVLVSLPKDDFFFPMVNRSGYAYEHRLIMAYHLNRCLHSWEIVHHKNGDKLDNRIENLQLLPDRSHHIVDSAAKAAITRLRCQVAILKKTNTELAKEVELLKAINE